MAVATQLGATRVPAHLRLLRVCLCYFHYLVAIANEKSRRKQLETRKKEKNSQIRRKELIDIEREQKKINRLTNGSPEKWQLDTQALPALHR